MPKKDIEKVLAGLDDEIVDIVGTFLKRRKNAYEKAAIRLKNEMRDDVVRYALLLENQKISADDFEFLVRGRSELIKIELLEQVSVSKSKFDLVSEDVVKLVLHSAITVVSSI